MSKPIIHVENLSKAYQIGQIGTGTISKDIERFWITKVLGKEDPFLKIGETNDRSKKGESNIVWSLKDINFEINKGDAVGIIGKNGAGKSTLLKLLSRVTSPTTGEIKVKGRIASLLEVGTGFHPELSGKENIYLNGAILGMRKKEITRKLDEIIDFSGVERYIDTPVKRYSSGMYVRLAFAVAAHLESEILIVDEVLAVGDAEFQKKCLGKMGDISKGEGRTILFVSHNLGAVSQLCNNAILLESGLIKEINKSDTVVKNYLAERSSSSAIYHLANDNVAKNMFFKSISLRNLQDINAATFQYTEDIFICFQIVSKQYLENTAIFVTILDQNCNRVFSAEQKIDKNMDKYVLKISNRFLASGIYSLSAFIHIPRVTRYDQVDEVCHFEVIDNGSAFLIHGNYNHGVVFGDYEWT
jgi:lipopolysaccharide transport system ATP-binding protein